MTIQKHSGLGDNVSGDKYEYNIHSLQAQDLQKVIDNIMSEVCYRDLDKAYEQLVTLNNITSLEDDVRLLLSALNLKVDLVKGLEPPSKNELLRLLKIDGLTENVRDVVISIIIDVESRKSETVARERYNDSNSANIYITEVFLERLASKDELYKFYKDSKIHDLLEQEITGLIRGFLRVQDFEFAVKVTQFLEEHFPSRNSRILLNYAKSCLLLTQNEGKHYISLSLNVKKEVDSLIIQLLENFEGDERHIATLVNLLNITVFLDSRLVDIGRQYINEIRAIKPQCAEIFDQFNSKVASPNSKFEFMSDSLDLEQFARLDSALENRQIKAKVVNKWVDNGGSIRIGDDCTNSFFDLYLRASICSSENKAEVLSLENRAQSFLALSSEKLYQINPYVIMKLGEKFVELKLPVCAVDFLSPFLSEDAWVSPFFECYLSVLVECEKFELFISSISHLETEDKTEIICLRERCLSN